MRAPQLNRPFDHLYDNTYVTAHPSKKEARAEAVKAEGPRRLLPLSQDQAPSANRRCRAPSSPTEGRRPIRVSLYASASSWVPAQATCSPAKNAPRVGTNAAMKGAQKTTL